MSRDGVGQFVFAHHFSEFRQKEGEFFRRDDDIVDERRGLVGTAVLSEQVETLVADRPKLLGVLLGAHYLHRRVEPLEIFKGKVCFVICLFFRIACEFGEEYELWEATSEYHYRLRDERQTEREDPRLERLYDIGEETDRKLECVI